MQPIPIKTTVVGSWPFPSWLEFASENLDKFGPADINEMIAQTYKIDPDEAIFYKHQNAFLLTSTQFEEVDQAQKDFASAMDKTLSQLVSDFSRLLCVF